MSKVESDRVLLSRVTQSNGTKFSPNQGRTCQDIFNELKRLRLNSSIKPNIVKRGH